MNHAQLVRRSLGNDYLQGIAEHADGLLETAPEASGVALDPGTQEWMGRAFGVDLSQVRVHTGERAAEASRRLGAQAYTVGSDIMFKPGRYAPHTQPGQRLLAHELAHVVQHRGGTGGGTMSGAALEADADRAAADFQAGRAPRLIAAADGTGPARKPDDVIPVQLITYLTHYTPPGGQVTYRVGDAAASSILMKIEEDSSRQVTFYWFNFSRGEPQSGTPAEWDFRVGAAVIGGNSRQFAAIGRALTADQWRSLWPDPRAALLKMYEEQKINLPDDAVVETYRGMIHTEAERMLDENERSVDSLLAAPDRLRFFQQYADGLREASMVRDLLETRKADVEHSMAQMQGFSFGMAGRVIGMDPARRLQLVRELGMVDQALTFWRASFPLLTRMRTADIQASNVEAVLRDIKASIVATRQQLAIAPQGRARFDLWDLDNVRARIDATLGPRATAAVQAEEASRRRWGWAKAAGMLAGSIALLFVPGGAFIDLAIGVAMGAQAVAHAEAMGRAAKTGIHVDDALVSQAAANSAEFEAVVATIFAVVGVAAGGLRVLRVGRLFLRVRQVAPAMGVVGQVRVARILADNPAWLRAGQNLGELNSAVLRAGRALGFEELRALRALVYEAQGARLLAQSRESLEELLDKVWAQRQRVISESDDILQRNAAERVAAEAERRAPRLRDPASPVYNLYSGATEANPLTRPAADYLRDIADIAQGRPAGAVSNVQNTGEAIEDLARAGRLTGGRYSQTFFRFERAGADLRNINERIYLNIKADHAPEVMRTVVRDIVDNPTQYPGIGMAKLTGPGAISGRADAIVIYANDAASVERAMVRIRAYHAANPRVFQETTPYITNRVLEGVSLGAEPVGAGGASFGQVRSRVIYDALRHSVEHGNNSEQFMREVFEGLRRAGVDPVAPHLNLPPAGQP
jgi:hypothetical protein